MGSRAAAPLDVLASQAKTIVRALLVNLPRDPRETMFPVELATIAAVLKAEGHEVAGLDLGKQGSRAWPAVAASYGVVLWMATPSTWPRVCGLLRKLDPEESRLVMVGGSQATLCPDDVLAEPAVDVAILGEGERVVGNVIRSWQQNDPAPIPGAVWQQRWTDRDFHSDRDFQRIDRLGELPLRDLDVFAVDDYTGMATRRARYTQIIASRGSGRSDAHSPLGRLLPGGRRTRPVQHVVEDMAMLHDQFGLCEFHFEDDSLFEDPDYIIELSRLIRSELPDIVWQAPSGCHPDDLHVELLEDLAAAGCYRIYLQLDSTSPDAMRLLKRPWTPGHIDRLAHEAHQVGIELGGYFTVGLPDESEAQMRATVRFAVDSGLSWAQFTPFHFNPGSALHDQRDDLTPRLPPGPLVRRIIRRAYWKFYGSGGRGLLVLRNINRHNAIQMFYRTFDKLVRGRPY